MIATLDDSAQRYLGSITEKEMCTWCRYPYKPTYSGGLCRHCYDIKAELRRLHREVEERKAHGAVHPTFGLGSLQFDYIAAIDMAEAAQGEGRVYGSLSKGDAPLDLEHEFGFISQKFLKKDLYRNSVDLFTYFTPPQRRLLMYVLSRMSREYLRRNRRKRAWYDIQKGRTTKQALEERFFGTYRVEKDPTVIGRRPAKKAG
jgi:hypothetical protein